MEESRDMPEPGILWTTARKLAVFRACFSGLQHVYGTYDLPTGNPQYVRLMYDRSAQVPSV